MRYRNLINELYKKRNKGVKLGLDRVLSVLEKFDNPHKKFKSIHVAGTNGKGSVSKIIYSLLRSHGVKTGLYTSPHLTRFTERIIVNDEEISEEDIVRLIEKIEPFAQDLTFFEYVTVMAFLYFNEKNVEYAVLETGMGGRLDATNVIMPEVSVITNIAVDHEKFLGSDLASIAAEKAGIIKEGIPVVSSLQLEEVEKVLIKKAEEKRAPVYIYGRDFCSELKNMDFDGIVFDFQSKDIFQSDLFLPLTGLYQVENVSVALKAFMTAYPLWDKNSLREGLRKVKMPGRLEVISKNPLIILDIAHNPHAARCIVNSLKILTDKTPVLVFGIMRDKDVRGFIKCFENFAKAIFFTVPSYERALNFKEFMERVNGCVSTDVYMVAQPEKAFSEAVNLCKKNTELFLLCTGSAYLIGEIKEFLGEKIAYRSFGELL